MSSENGIGKAVVIVDPISTGRYLADEFRAKGWLPIGVLSTSRFPDLLPAHYGEMLRTEFEALIDEGGDLPATLNYLAKYSVEAVIAGSEPGVELADLLAEKLGVPGNSHKRSVVRRDKCAMARLLSVNGIAAPRTRSVTTSDQAIQWADRHSLWPLVVKPRRSTGSEKVFFCSTPAAVECAMSEILGHVNRLGERNNSVCVQELLSGQQYVVNMVSRAGNHAVCEIWKDTRRYIPGHSLAYDTEDLLPYDDPKCGELVAYMSSVLDALGVMEGPSHSEIMWTASGPQLIEVGARLQGSIRPECVRSALGHNHVTRSVDAVTDAVFNEEPYTIRKKLRVVSLVSPLNGYIRDAALLSKARLPSLAGIIGEVHDGKRVAKTIDIFTRPAALYLLANSAEELDRDTRCLRQLERDGLYANVA